MSQDKAFYGQSYERPNKPKTFLLYALAQTKAYQLHQNLALHTNLFPSFWP